MTAQAFRVGSVAGRSISVFGKNFLPFSLLYLVINVPSLIYALTQSAETGRDTASNMLALAQTIVGMAAQATLSAVGHYSLRVAKEGVEIGDIAAVFD